ncbi:MAG: hypothetical protein C0507_16105 [Cyanobacteria bacterium PR.3.49]|nr:hypothetical protein [Cyanobacteria bacterium PR.3.49]
MSKKKKASPKQTKQNVQKPQAKAGKDDSAPQKAAVDASKKKEQQTKPVQSQVKEKPAEPAQPPKAQKAETSKAKAETSPTPAVKDEPKVQKSSAKGEQSGAKPSQSAPKAEAVPEAKSQDKTPEPSKPEVKKSAQSDKQAKGKSKKKSKGGKQPVAVEQVVEQESTDDETTELKPEVREPEDIDKTVEISTPAASETSTSDGSKRKVAKTLIDDEIDASPGKEISEGDKPTVDSPQSGVEDTIPPADAALIRDSERKVAKTILEVNISGLAEAAAKATGTQKAAPQGGERKVAKTMMEMDTTGLRDSVEMSSRAIEDEIAAAIKEAENAETAEAAESVQSIETVHESKAEPEVSEPNQQSGKKSSERPIARTLLDVRAEDLFELVASMEGQESSDADSESESQSAIEPVLETTKNPEPAAAQPRKVAKTMLESDSPDIGKLIAEANAIAFEEKSPAVEQKHQSAEHDLAPEPERRQGTDDVSIADLSEFAQALKEDKPMSPPSPRVEKLRKTLMNIRKHGIETSSSYPSVRAPRESIEASGTQGTGEIPATPEFNLDAKQAPLRVSRSLHTIETIGKPGPAAEEPIDRTVEAPLPDFEGGANALTKRTGTVEMNVDPHDDSIEDHHANTPARVTEEGFKGVTTVWPHDQEHQDAEQNSAEGAQPGTRKPERFVARTMLDMDFLKDSLSASVQRAEEKMAESIAQKMSEPPKQVLTQDDYKLAQTGCPFVWTDNPDNPKERVKYCTECSLQVYNFAGFDMTEAQLLIFKRENRSNAPLYKREDGKFMTADCPIASKKKKDNQMLIGGAALVVVLLLIMVVASFLSPQPPPAPPATTDQPPGVSTSPDTPPPATNTKTGGQSSATSSSVDGDKGSNSGTYHYVRGKGVVQQPVIVKPQEPVDNTIPGTTSGFDEGGQFWQYTDKGNN